MFITGKAQCVTVAGRILLRREAQQIDLVMAQFPGGEMLSDHKRAGLVMERHGESARIGRAHRSFAIAHQEQFHLAQAVPPGGEGLLDLEVALRGGQGRIQAALSGVFGHDRPAQVTPRAMPPRAKRGHPEHNQRGDNERDDGQQLSRAAVLGRNRLLGRFIHCR